MTETRTAQVVSARDWLAEHVADDAPPVLVTRPSTDSEAEDSGEPDTVDQAAPAETARPDTGIGGHRRRGAAIGTARRAGPQSRRHPGPRGGRRQLRR